MVKEWVNHLEVLEQVDGRFYPVNTQYIATAFFYRGSSGRNEEPISYKNKRDAVKFIQRIKRLETRRD